MHPLDGSNLKIERAKHHLDTLERSILDFFESKPYSVRLKEHDQGTIYQLHLMKALPQEWGLMVGDIAANLRASLDYVVFQLSLPSLEQSTHPRDWNAPQFPICDTENEYSSEGTRHHLSFVPERGREKIKELQPYHKKDWPDLELLSTLRDISNSDKHRLLTPTFSEVDLGFGGVATPRHPFRLDKHGDGFTTVITKKVRAHMEDDLTPELAHHAAVDTTTIRKEGITVHSFPISILVKMHAFIRDEVLPTLAGCFAQ